MKTIFWFALLSILGLCVSGSAQLQTAAPGSEYHLRELTIDEFLDALPDFEKIFYSTDAYDVPQLIQAAEAEFLMRFGETASFRELQIAFNQFRPKVSRRSYREVVPIIAMNTWMARLLERWLADNPVNFDDLETIDDYSFDITIEPHDFDLDGEPEWILDVQYIPNFEVIYRNYLVADGSEGQYHILPVWIPYLENSETWQTDPNAFFSKRGFQDINADGQMEWLFSTNEYGPGGPGYTGMIFRFYALEWRDGQFVELYDGAGTPQNLDDDPALEFTQSVTTIDNWSCGTRTTQIWDWDGSAYIQQQDQVEPIDCTGRHAEEAMWNGDFQTAAALYDTFLEQNLDHWENYLECRSVGDSVCEHSLTKIYSYFLGRRIIAYALLGDSAKVRDLLDEIAGYPEKTWFMMALIAADTVDAKTLCQAAYDTFTTFTPDDRSPAIRLLPGIIVRNINDGWDHAVGFRVDPAKAGCDINLFGSSPTPTPTLTPTPFPTYPAPTPDTRTVQEQWMDWEDVYSPFRAGDYETALLIVEQATPKDETDAPRLHYWRALVYEALGRTDDAIREYSTLYLEYPGNWWAWMAGLHLTK